MLEHIDWVHPDNIVLSNSNRNYSYQKMTDDIQNNGVKEIRLLRRRISKKIYSSKFTSLSDEYYFRYVVNREIFWFYVDNPIPRKGVYYTAIHLISQEEYDELNNLFKVINRDDKLNELGI